MIVHTSATISRGAGGFLLVWFHVGAFVTLFVFAPFPSSLPVLLGLLGRLPSRRFVGTSNAAHLPSLGRRAIAHTYGRIPAFLPCHPIPDSASHCLADFDIDSSFREAFHPPKNLP